MEKYITMATLIFLGCSMINVMLSTVKSILTVKASKGVATLINAITYGFYAIVVKQLATLDITTTVIITIVTNLIGVYISIALLEKFKKDTLWKISVTTQNKAIIDELIEKEVQYYSNKVKYKQKDLYVIDIFSYTQAESSVIKGILKDFDVKYNITKVSESL